MKDKIAILIPSLNPGEKLVNLVDELLKCGWRNIIIVNDGSEERYNQYFSNLEGKAIILKHAINLGKGRALKTGFNEYLKTFPNLRGIITVDSDGQHKVKDVEKVARKLLETENAMVLGAREFNEKQVPFKSRYGNKITRAIFSFLTGIKIKDTQTGLRGIPTRYIEKLMNIPGERYEYEMNMLMYAKNYDIEIIEETIETVYIEENKSSHFNPLTDSFRIYLIFLKYLLSSAISFIIDIGLYKILFNLLINSIANYAVMIATIGSRIVSSLVNYKINRDTVFKSSSRNSVIKYYILCIIQMMISAGIVSYVFQLLGQQHEVVIRIITDIILFFINFKIQKEWVFKKKRGNK